MTKWTAMIDLDGEQVPADPSPYDTLKETTDSAVKEAVEYLRAGLASEARVILFKQLKNDAEPVEDRQGAFLYLDSAGRVLVSR